MKTKLFFIAIAVMYASLNIHAATISKVNQNDSIKHRINIRVNDNKIVLRADCLKGQKRLNYILKVYSEEGEMIYASTFLKKGAIYKMYDISNLPKGKYSFVVYKMLKPLYAKEILKTSDPGKENQGEPLLVEEL